MSCGSCTRSIAMRSFVSASAGLLRRVEHVGPRDVRLLGPRAREVEVVERAGDVRERLLAEVGAGIARQLLLLVGVVEQVHELVHRRLVALLLEERPRVLVERDAEERRLLVLHRPRVGARRAVVVPHRERLVVEDAAGAGRAGRTPSRRCATRPRRRTSGSCPGSTFGCGIIAQSLRVRIVEGASRPSRPS